MRRKCDTLASISGPVLARTCFKKGLRKVIPMSPDNDFLTDARDSARVRRSSSLHHAAAILNFTRGGARQR